MAYDNFSFLIFYFLHSHLNTVCLSLPLSFSSFQLSPCPDYSNSLFLTHSYYYCCVCIYIYMFINTNHCFYLVPLILCFYRADQLGLDHPDADQFFSSQQSLMSVVLHVGVGPCKSSPIHLRVLVLSPPSHVFSAISILTVLRVSEEIFKIANAQYPIHS